MRELLLADPKHGKKPKRRLLALPWSRRSVRTLMTTTNAAKMVITAWRVV